MNYLNVQVAEDTLKNYLQELEILDLVKEFFKTVQNKMHWATHGHTAAEIIVERANAKRNFIGLTSFYPTKEDAEIANNIIFFALCWRISFQ